MKFIGRLSLILIPLIIFSGCKIKEYTPELPISFNQKAVVSTGDFSFECEICCNMTKNIITLTVLSTQAEGLSFSYNGSELSFCYDGFDLALSGKAFEKSNTAVIIYDVCSALMTTDTPEVSRIEGGFKYQGKTPFGEFILIQNENSTLKSLSFKHSDYVVTFY